MYPVKYRVLFVSGREISYIRNRVLLNALEKFCDVTVLTGNGKNIPSRILTGLLRFLTHRQKHDICWAGFYGQPFALILPLVSRKPVILDAYVSTYDTLCEDRALFRPHSLPGRLAYWLDLKSCEKATLVVTDTLANAQYFIQKMGISAEKLRVVYVGCDESLFYPRSEAESSSHCEVFYYGSFLPLHGTDVIIQAAFLLKDRQDIHFTIGGDGFTFLKMEQAVKRLGLRNIDLVGWIPIEQLPTYIARASICLGGHFSTIPKAGRVISTKTFQFIAMRKPTIVGDNEASREVFVSGEHVYAVQPGNPQSLAEAICLLMDNWELRQRVAEGGYNIFGQRFATSVITQKLSQIIKEIKCEYVS